MGRAFQFLLLLSAICQQLATPLDAAELQRYETTEPHMGMAIRVVLYATSAEQAKSASDRVYDRFRALNSIFSDYDPDSELSRLSATSQAAQPSEVRVSRELMTVLQFSQQLSEQSQGAFDITVGPLTQLWRKTKRSRKLPEAQVFETARTATGFQHLQLDPKQQTVRLLKPGMRLDAGGIAVGFAIDQSLAELTRHGITSAMIDASGDIGCTGPPPGERGWRIGIAPLNPNAPPSRYLRLANAALTTSGDAYQAVTLDGVRYSHIVDPRTGLGVTRSSAVTVIAPTAIVADSLATAICVLGPESGVKLLAKYPGSVAHLILAPASNQPADPVQTVITQGFEKWEETPTLAP